MPPSGSDVVASGSRMLSTGTWILRSSGLRTPASTILHSRPLPTRKRPTSSSGRWVADSPMRCSLRAGHVLEALERQREVGAALGARHRMDLVDDHRLGVHEELPRLRREHQVERLGRGYQHVGWRAEHRLALLLGGVAGADGDADVAADALERGAQVLLDVVRERLQGGDVDEARRARARPPGGRGPTGTRRASFPSRWAPTPGRSHRWRSRATPGPAPRSDARRSA